MKRLTEEEWRPRSHKERPGVRLYSSAVVARLCGITVRRVNQLAREGVFRKYGKNAYDLEEALPAYVATLREAAVRNGDEEYREERTRLVRAKRERAELELAVYRRTLHRAEDIERHVSAMLATFRARLLGMPAKLAPRLQGVASLPEVQEIIRVEVYECLTELSEYDPEDYGGKAGHDAA